MRGELDKIIKETLEEFTDQETGMLAIGKYDHEFVRDVLKRHTDKVVALVNKSKSPG